MKSLHVPNGVVATDVPAVRMTMCDQLRPGTALSKVIEMSGSPTPGTTYHSINWERRNLATCELWYCTPELVPVVLAAAKGLPADLMVTDLPALTTPGLVVFGASIAAMDADQSDHPLFVDALLWAGTSLRPLPGYEHVAGFEQRTSVSIASYCRTDPGSGLSDLEMKNPRTLALLGEAGGAEFSHDPESGDLRKSWTKPGVGAFWSPLGKSDWPTEFPLNRPAVPAIDEQRAASMEEDRRLLAGFLAVAHERKLSTRSKAPMSHRMRRPMERRKLGTDVTVIRLREYVPLANEDGSIPESGSVEWTCQWLVSGHWRKLPEGHKARETGLPFTWVTGHMKGPADKPLKDPGSTVKALIR